MAARYPSKRDGADSVHCCARSVPAPPTCWDYSTPFLYVASLAASLLSAVPMGRVTYVWSARAGPATFPICPLFAAARSRDSWGQHDSAACLITTFLPTVPLAVSLCLCIYSLVSVVYADRRRQRRSVAADVTTAVITLVTMALCVAEVGLVTDGFRNTCFGFQVEDYEYEGKVRYSSFNEVLTCRQGFDTKDRDHMVTGVKTYGQLISAMVGAWLNTLVWLVLSWGACARACHWCSSPAGGNPLVPVRVVRRRYSLTGQSNSGSAQPSPQTARRRRESWV